MRLLVIISLLFTWQGPSGCADDSSDLAGGPIPRPVIEELTLSKKARDVEVYPMTALGMSYEKESKTYPRVVFFAEGKTPKLEMIELANGLKTRGTSAPLMYTTTDRLVKQYAQKHETSVCGLLIANAWINSRPGYLRLLNEGSVWLRKDKTEIHLKRFTVQRLQEADLISWLPIATSGLSAKFEGKTVKTGGTSMADNLVCVFPDGFTLKALSETLGGHFAIGLLKVQDPSSFAIHSKTFLEFSSK